MGEKAVPLTLFLVSLLCAILTTPATAQTRTPGVNEGDWFFSSEFKAEWSSNDTSAKPSSRWMLFNETEWGNITIIDISGTNITAQFIMHFKNGTESSSEGCVDIDTGEGDKGVMMIIAANLTANDPIYTSSSYLAMRINMTVLRDYPDEIRETNRLYIINESPIGYNYTYSSADYYWDKRTGILVEMFEENVNMTGSLRTQWSISYKVTNSNIWVIPEFTTWMSILILFTASTFALVAYKRRLPKKLH